MYLKKGHREFSWWKKQKLGLVTISLYLILFVKKQQFEFPPNKILTILEPFIPLYLGCHQQSHEEKSNILYSEENSYIQPLKFLRVLDL